jgi:hypothetical protein
MWQVENRTPLAAHGYFARDRNGAEHWVVAVRGKFRVRADGQAELHEHQMPPRLAPVYADSNNLELWEESDFAPFRPHVDVFLRGFVYATSNTTTAMQPFGFRLGALQKLAGALPARRIRKRAGSWELFGQSVFEPVPLRWTESLGGIDRFSPDTRSAVAHPLNPIGRGWSAHLASAPNGAEIDLPRVESLQHAYHPNHPMPLPVGFGPIQPAWHQRLAHAGTFDEAWRVSRAPLLPGDCSNQFYQAAPPDQIYPDELRGGEPVTVYGMHPEGNYAFWLPKLHLRANTKLAGQWNRHHFRLISVSIDGTAKTLDMVWNAHLLCTGQDHRLEVSRVTLLRELWVKV